MSRFLSIPKKECLIVYKDILENSNQKWEAGRKLAEINEYGSAISIAIISIEELVKSLIVFLDGKGFDFRSVKGINVFFRSHQIRYVLAYIMFVMSVFGDELIKFIMNVKSDPEKFVKVSEEIQNDKDYFDKNLKFYFLKKLVVLRKEFRWFAKADIFRQDGFYCDYKEQLKNPISISKEEYMEVFIRLEKVRKVGVGIIDAFNTPEEIYATQLKQLKKDFKNKGYYRNISEALSKVSKTRENPFDLLRDALS